MIKDVKNYPISQLFDIEQSVVYLVPRFQREYSWNKWQWERLFDDILDNDAGYFLGSIICINQSTDALAVQTLDLVDGQQRLTTLSILFAAIYAALNAKKEDLDEDRKSDLLNLKRKLVLKKNGECRVIPQIHNNNQQDYMALLGQCEVSDPIDRPAYAGNRKIFKAFNYFNWRISRLCEESEDEGDALFEYLDRITQACIVKIEVASHADAYTLFESLNNRGMPLTAVDLLKNKLLAELEREDPGKIDKYFNKWTDLLRYLGDNYAIQERFFRHYYNAFKLELAEVVSVPVATRSNLIAVYEKLISAGPKNCLENLTESARTYGLFVFQREDESFKPLAKSFQNLERIQGAPSYLLLLYLVEKREQLELSMEVLKQICDVLISFFVRRNLTDTPPTRDLTRLFMGVISALGEAKGTAVLDVIKNQIFKVSASDQIFLERLKGPIYAENSWVTRFLLCTLAEEKMTKETEVDLWRYEGKHLVWTIEHIFPQGENIPDSWVSMIADGNRTRASEIQEECVHQLGNLTITGFNSSLGNKSFQEKRDRTDKKGRPVGYKNGLLLNAELAETDSWNAEKIEERTARLAEELRKCFSLT